MNSYYFRSYSNSFQMKTPKLKWIATIALLSHFIIHSNAQELNIFDNEPDVIKTTLHQKYKRVDIQIVRPANARQASKNIGSKTILFSGDTACSIYTKSDSGEGDTIYYHYDRCGNLTRKDGHSTHCLYVNSYTGCKLKNRQSNEVENYYGLSHTQNTTKYQYDKKGRLEKELIYNYSDLDNIQISREYKYVGEKIDTIVEYYYNEGERTRLRATKNYYSTTLDSIHFYNFEMTIIDRFVYQYNTDGSLKMAKGGSQGEFEYSYNSKGDPEIIKDKMKRRELLITYTPND